MTPPLSRTPPRTIPIRSARRASLAGLLGAAAGLVLAPVARADRAATPGAPAGEIAPGITLMSDTGPVALQDFRGKVVYLDFWASWCGPCRQSFPWMTEMQARYGARGLQVLAVSVDARPDDARRFLAANPAGFQVAFDPAGDAARRFAIRSMPTSVLIGTDGRVITSHAGFRPTDREPLEAGIREALARR